MDSGGIVVRAATEADSDDVWLLTQAFATSFVPTRTAFDRSLSNVLADVDALLLVAQDPAEAVGYLLAHRHLTLFADGSVAWVEELMVHERARRVGVGRQLMERAEGWAREGGARYLALATRRAAEFYQALGYQDSAVFFRKLL